MLEGFQQGRQDANTTGVCGVWMLCERWQFRMPCREVLVGAHGTQVLVVVRMNANMCDILPAATRCWRVSCRLSGTGSSGATIRLYIEQYTDDKARLKEDAQKALADIIKVRDAHTALGLGVDWHMWIVANTAAPEGCFFCLARGLSHMVKSAVGVEACRLKLAKQFQNSTSIWTHEASLWLI